MRAVNPPDRAGPRRRLKLSAGLASVALVAAACGSSSATNSTTTPTAKAPTGTPIVVGQIYPATGANLALPEAGNSLKASIAGLNNFGRDQRAPRPTHPVRFPG